MFCWLSIARGLLGASSMVGPPKEDWGAQTDEALGAALAAGAPRPGSRTIESRDATMTAVGEPDERRSAFTLAAFLIGAPERAPGARSDSKASAVQVVRPTPIPPLSRGSAPAQPVPGLPGRDIAVSDDAAIRTGTDPIVKPETKVLVVSELKMAC